MFLTLAQTLSRTLGVRIGPNELFSNSTVAQLATRLIELAATPAPAPQANGRLGIRFPPRNLRRIPPRTSPLN